MVKQKRNFITIDLNEYNDALKKSMFDSEWVQNLYTDKENLLEFFSRIGDQNFIKNAMRFEETKNIKYLLQTKNSTLLPDFANDLFFEAGKPETTMQLINEIYQKTNYYAERVEDLLNEYSENTRNFFETTIKPFPDNIEDTWKPITKFKIGNQIASLEKNSIKFLDENCEFSQYFTERKSKKLLKKLHLTYKTMPESEYKTTRRRLLNYKESLIPTHCAEISPDNASYKITLKSNQTVKRDNQEYTLLGECIRVYHIQEIK